MSRRRGSTVGGKWRGVQYRRQAARGPLSAASGEGPGARAPVRAEAGASAVGARSSSTSRRALARRAGGSAGRTSRARWLVAGMQGPSGRRARRGRRGGRHEHFGPRALTGGARSWAAALSSVGRSRARCGRRRPASGWPRRGRRTGRRPWSSCSARRRSAPSRSAASRPRPPCRWWCLGLGLGSG